MKIQFSAGGVVYKKENSETLILVSQHSQHHGWVFPKGLIGDHVEKEDKEETALREVKEETGAEGKIIRALNPITYWLVMDKDPSAGRRYPEGHSGQEKVRKTVYYYLMEFIGGDITKHDHEMEKVEWLPVEKVEDRLTYKSDKIVWAEAKFLI
ncbi:MAG: hydrolase [Candidatus Levybacteria bacterium]|nr:hydrolase [Candidatus Levybacteria bacterium]